jgi:hypothetical protein
MVNRQPKFSILPATPKLRLGIGVEVDDSCSIQWAMYNSGCSQLAAAATAKPVKVRRQSAPLLGLGAGVGAKSRERGGPKEYVPERTQLRDAVSDLSVVF